MRFVAVAAVMLAGCAPVSSEGLLRTPAKLSIPSTKSPRAFAMCVASALPDAGQMLNEGEHYWLTRQYGGTTYERWDFAPTPTGSVAERRSGQMTSYGTGSVRDCAQG